MSNSPKNLYKKLLGIKGERLTIKYLKKQGYKILEKNYSTKFGEADIIAKKDNNIVFVEVKTRTSERFGTPSQAVGYDKQRKYKNLALFYMQQNNLDDCVLSFAVSEVLNGEINFINEAFQ